MAEVTISNKVKAFALFDAGFRPSEIYDEVTVKKHTLYWYYQLWKKAQDAERLQQEAEQEVKRRQQEAGLLASELHAIEMTLDDYRRYPEHLVQWWSIHPEINRLYSTPEEYLRALERRHSYLLALTRQRT